MGIQLDCATRRAGQKSMNESQGNDCWPGFPSDNPSSMEHGCREEILYTVTTQKPGHFGLTDLEEPFNL